VTVIRRGKTGESRSTSGLSAEELRRSIFGNDVNDRDNYQEINSVRKTVPAANDSSCPGERPVPILVIRDLTLEPPGIPRLRNISLELGPGKILGITGVREGGLETLELALTGKAFDGGVRGSITLNGRDITGKGMRAFRRAGGAYLGADRLGNNLAPELPLFESLVIHAFRKFRRGIFLDMRRLNSWCGKIMNKAGIRRSVSDKPASFSGGMLQRILLARELAEEASLVILAEAGSGLDQINRAKLENELRVLANNGLSALLL
jgi:simple sugar transport system ATP-binding protein